MIQPRLRIISVGDEQVGKTWLIHMLCDKEIPQEYVPTTYENYCIDKMICGQSITFFLRDTAGRSSVDDFRSICFNNADVFLLCFAADDRESFINLQTKWIPYSRSKVENAKMILVETKCDQIYPEVFKINDDSQIVKEPPKKSENIVPDLNLNESELDLEAKVITNNSKSDHKIHPKISIPKSSRNSKNKYLSDIASSRKRSRSPPKLLNRYLGPNMRSIVEAPKESCPVSGRRKSLQRQLTSGNFYKIENNINQRISDEISNMIKSKINYSASCEVNVKQETQLKNQENSPSNSPKTFEIKELPEIPEIDQIISEEEIKNLCLEEGISGFIKTCSIAGFQSESILELSAKICALKKKWAPPFRRRVSKS